MMPAGETIGYHDQVVFPVFVKPEKLDAAVSLQLNMFFAVCKDICIPAKAKAGAALERLRRKSPVGRMAEAPAAPCGCGRSRLRDGGAF